MAGPGVGAGVEDICLESGDHSAVEKARLEQPFVIGSLETPGGRVPLVSSSLFFKDHLGTFKARWGIGRMHYRVAPGLYGVGAPDEKSQVLVTANYKMSFDSLRKELRGRSAWIMVLDTKGINVWCAAGKGTFGTEELVERVETTRIKLIVAHRELILPQLSAPGVAAHLVKKHSGFKVIYGPIRAGDLPSFLDNGNKVDPEMRIKTFTTRERFVLIPVELVGALKGALLIAVLLCLLSGILGPSGFFSNIESRGLFASLGVLFSVLAGAVFTPLLLPWIPGRAFSIKGFLLGLVGVLGMVLIRAGETGAWATRMELLGWFFLLPSLSAYLGMTFTGASSFTSLSGVKREMKWALPAEIAGGLMGAGLWIGSMLVKV
ncbi:MAG: acetyl-CoA synthase subunit gamma [Deltaproteobacteria bacterium]|nr:acetyl-CoA synthase subunit gamma [Deltaproteobacteria bacterium]